MDGPVWIISAIVLLSSHISLFHFLIQYTSISSITFSSRPHYLEQFHGACLCFYTLDWEIQEATNTSITSVMRSWLYCHTIILFYYYIIILLYSHIIIVSYPIILLPWLKRSGGSHSLASLLSGLLHSFMFYESK